ncbi:MAG: tRNA 2-selenouridine(34) synthase MnmH [Bacteroidota bacterium]
MIERITIDTFLDKYSDIPLVDVRSPGEFKQGHIPNANNIPLFSNDERAEVGTVYKKQSKQAAINLGYFIVEPKLDYYIEESMLVAPSKVIAIHCWRGGMRSQSFAEHLLENGFEKVYVIEKGYKAFRNFALLFFEQTIKLKILGGYTGSGKTDVLPILKERGEQVIDLEGLANHKGSAFGAIGENEQPTVEQFQNNLFIEMYGLNLDRIIWLEDESSNIGKVVIPHGLYSQMREQMVYFLDISVKERAKYLANTYGLFERVELEKSILKITKRLGSDRAKLAIDALSRGDLEGSAVISLKYYDKFYLMGLEKRNPKMVTRIVLDTVDASASSDALMAF